MEDMESSFFTGDKPTYPDAELLQIGGATCQCYKVKLHGKLHFLKRLKPELQSDPRYVAAMRKEFETGYLLDHPSLVRYLSRTDDSILMDYVDGETLDQFIGHHPDYFKENKNADRFVSQLLDVVGYLHQHQVIHLDLKPANILITRIDHDVKLADLGFCYTDTYTDTIGYTESYAAPELLSGSALPDSRTDIYAIGKVLQRLPCAKRYSKAIKRCTESNPLMRYQSVAELQAALRPRRRWMTLAAIATTVVALAALAYFLPYARQHYSANTAPAADSLTQTATNDSTPSTGIAQNGGNAAVHLPNQGATAKAAEEPAIAAPNTIVPQPAVPQQPGTNTNPAPSAKRHVEMSELRKELKSACQSILNSTMGHLRGKPYDSGSWNKAYYQYVKTSAANDHDLWDSKYQHTDISMKTFYTEASQMMIELCDVLYKELPKDSNTQEANE